MKPCELMLSAGTGLVELERRPAVDLGERREALGHAADDRERHREAERACPRSRSGVAANRDPHRQRILERAGVDAGAVERRPMTPGPADVLGVTQLQQELELLDEELVVVGEVVPEERERLDERAPAGHDLGATAREEVERRELLEHAHRIVRAEHADGARQPDMLRPLGHRCEGDRRGRDGEIRPMVLADAEDVEPDLVGKRCLLDQVAQALRGRDRAARCRVGGELREGVETEFHE